MGKGHSGRRGTVGLLFALFLSLGFSVIFSVCFGSVSIPVHTTYRILAHHLMGLSQEIDWADGLDLIVWQIRCPRVLAAAAAGGIFAVSGIFMQTLTQNPVAEPYILGVSSGASAGAVSAIVFGFFLSFHGYGIQIAAFMGAMISLLAVLALAGTKPTPLRLILLGLGISAFFSAVTTFVLNQAQNDSQLRSALFWMLGSFSAIQWVDTPMMYVCLAVAWGWGLLFQKELDGLLLGDSVAASLGISVHPVKSGIAVVSAVIVALVVSKVGVIGFVGLIVPHVARRLVGVSHARLVPVAVLLGGVFMVWADTFARSIFSPEELPVGILTSMIGAPLFVWIVRKDYSFGGQS